jgi:outer membrane protein TolC
MNGQDVRWRKAQQLLDENALDIATMAACLGQAEQSLEAMLGQSPSRGISDKLARLMEQTFSKPAGWLDQGDDGGISYDLFGE